MKLTLRNPCPLGLEELDHLLGGGVPRGSTVLALGPPGSGKCLFALRFLCEGATRYGEKGAYVSLLQPRSKFMEFTRSLGMDFSELESRGLFKYVDLTPQLRSEFTEMFLLSALSSLRAEGVSRIVVDGLTVVLQGLSSVHARAAFAFSLCKLLQELGATAVLLVDTEALADGSIASAAFLEKYATTILSFSFERVGGYVHRVLRVNATGGISVTVPFAVMGSKLKLLVPPTSTHRKSKTLKVVLGERAEALVVPAGSQILVLYPHGGGYALEALTMALKSSVESEVSTLLVSFTTPAGWLKSMAEEVAGSELQRVRVEFVDPISYSLAEVVARVWEAVEEFSPDLVVLHGLRTLMELHADEKPAKFALLNSQALRARGVTCIGLYGVARPRERIPVAEFCDVVIRISKHGGVQVVRPARIPSELARATS